MRTHARLLRGIPAYPHKPEPQHHSICCKHTAQLQAVCKHPLCSTSCSTGQPPKTPQHNMFIMCSSHLFVPCRCDTTGTPAQKEAHAPKIYTHQPPRPKHMSAMIGCSTPGNTLLLAVWLSRIPRRCSTQFTSGESRGSRGAACHSAPDACDSTTAAAHTSCPKMDKTQQRGHAWYSIFGGRAVQRHMVRPSGPTVRPK